MHQCIRPLLGAHCAPGHHGYQRACDLISGQASTGPLGSPVFACAGKTDPPSSSHPLADLGGLTKLHHREFLILRCSFVRAWRPFLRPGLRVQTRRAQGRSRLAVGRSLRLAAMLPGHALAAPSTARGSHRTGCHRIGLDAREGAPLVENRPSNASKLIGQRNGKHVVVQSLLRRFNPGFEPIAFPLLWPELDQHDPGGLNEQGAQIAIAAPPASSSTKRNMRGDRTSLRVARMPGSSVRRKRNPCRTAMPRSSRKARI